MPSSSQLIALLGLLAVAGYQNRDRIAGFLDRMGISGGGNSADAAAQPAAGSEGGLLGGVRNLLGGLGGSSGVSSSLGELVGHFRGAGREELPQSWIGTGPNREPTTGDLEAALGEDSILALTERTGLSRSELLERLRIVLPTAVDRMTPHGRVPSSQEMDGLFDRL